MKKLRDIHKIVALGDSVTFGKSASSPQKCWASLAAADLSSWCGYPIELVNKGISSNILCVDTPAYAYAALPAGIERFRRDVIAQKPDLLFIAYGLNDARGGTSLETFCRDYQKMLDEIRRAIDPVIVILDLYYMHQNFYKDCPPRDHSDLEKTAAFNNAIRELAERNGLAFADVYAAQAGVDWAVCGDHCHPNDLGHRLIANRVFEAVVRACPC